VKQGEPLLEVESEKVTVEVESPAAGTLGKILFPRGANVPVTHVVAIVLARGESLPEGYGHAAPDVSEERAAPSQSDASSGKTTQVRAVPLASRLARQHKIDLALVAPSGPHNTIMKMDVEAYLAAAKEEAKEAKVEERVKASPLARSMAAKEGLDLAVVKGTGPGGRIVKEDVLRAIDERKTVSRKGVPPETVTVGMHVKEALETTPITGARRVIFENMSLSLSQTAQLTLHTEAGAEALVDLRERLNGRLPQQTPKISYNAILVKIAAMALRRHPRINASVEDDQITVWRQINVGVAMESEDSLVVPVIRDSDLKSISEIHQEILEFMAKIRDRRLLPDDLANGTFTISNLGFADIDYFTPILRPPESALIGIGRIVEKPTVKAGQIIPQKRLGLSLTFDHRIIDGAPAARFLKTIKEIIESPVLMVT
jgi:pyruvate/2-oxoglutarate dehydrogenase complex dihydrolipoamide acyltransferase (E2) component